MMDNLPIKQLLAGIGGVAIYALIVGLVFQLAIRYHTGGPFSNIFSAVGTIGPVALGLLGGGLIIAVSFVLGLIPDRGF